MSASVHPSAINPITNSTDSRVPRMTGLPASTSALSAMRDWSVMVDEPLIYRLILLRLGRSPQDAEELRAGRLSDERRRRRKRFLGSFVDPLVSFVLNLNTKDAKECTKDRDGASSAL